jgi:threonylcarbamoyladenosine tRNA methylthiotransferase MtaB
MLKGKSASVKYIETANLLLLDSLRVTALYTGFMPAFHIEHFGCRAARADGEAVSERLLSAGLGQRTPTEADVVVVNTCSVTAEADRAARAFIRRTHRTNPAARIVVTGCYAQRAPEELAQLQGVSAVVGNSHKAFAPEISMRLATTPGLSFATQSSAFVSICSLLTHTVGERSVPIWADDRFAHSFLEEAELLPGTQTRPNLKIQEGCSNRCTFCVIPQTRGFSRSLPAVTVLRHVHNFVAAGGKELVLSGINLGRWGHDLDKASDTRLSALARRIFDETALPRLRLSSIEPMDWNPDLISLLRTYGASGRLARHAHLPLQSGSDAVLRRMHRRYRPWHYEEKVWALVQAAGPMLTLGADVMAGFPGETDREFEETLDFVRKLPFGYLHLFPFSPRPGTRGWALHAESPVLPQAVSERMEALRAVAAEKSLAHRKRFIGHELAAITLHTSSDLWAKERSTALSDNFLPIELHGSHAANSLISVCVTSVTPEGLLRAKPACLPETPSPNATDRQ